MIKHIFPKFLCTDFYTAHACSFFCCHNWLQISDIGEDIQDTFHIIVDNKFKLLFTITQPFINSILIRKVKHRCPCIRHDHTIIRIELLTMMSHNVLRHATSLTSRCPIAGKKKCISAIFDSEFIQIFCNNPWKTPEISRNYNSKYFFIIKTIFIFTNAVYYIAIIFSEKSANNVRFANLLVLSDNLNFILITPTEYLCTDVHLLIIYQPYNKKSIFTYRFLPMYGHSCKIVHKNASAYLTYTGIMIWQNLILFNKTSLNWTKSLRNGLPRLWHSAFVQIQFLRVLSAFKYFHIHRQSCFQKWYVFRYI